MSTTRRTFVKQMATLLAAAYAMPMCDRYTPIDQDTRTAELAIDALTDAIMRIVDPIYPVEQLITLKQEWSFSTVVQGVASRGSDKRYFAFNLDDDFVSKQPYSPMNHMKNAEMIAEHIRDQLTLGFSLS